MYQEIIIYERKKSLRKNLHPYTIIQKNTVMYEIRKILRKINVHAQKCIKTRSSTRRKKFQEKCTSMYNNGSRHDHP